MQFTFLVGPKIVGRRVLVFVVTGCGLEEDLGALVELVLILRDVVMGLSERQHSLALARHIALTAELLQLCKVIQPFHFFRRRGSDVTLRWQSSNLPIEEGVCVEVIHRKISLLVLKRKGLQVMLGIEAFEVGS